MFDHPDQGQSSSQQLLQLSQGTGSVADYAISFRILEANNGLNDAALFPVFRCGLTAEIQLELACRDAGLDLDGVIELAIKLDQHLRGKSHCSSVFPGVRAQSWLGSEEAWTRDPSPTPTTHEEPEPMQIGSSWLTPEERKRRVS